MAALQHTLLCFPLLAGLTLKDSQDTHVPFGAPGSSWKTIPGKRFSKLLLAGWEPGVTPGQGISEGLEDFP